MAPQKLSRVRFMGLSGSSSSVAKWSSFGSGRGLTYFRACVKSKFYGAFVLNFEHLNNDRRPASSIAGSALTPEPLKRAKPRPVYRDGRMKPTLVGL